MNAVQKMNTVQRTLLEGVIDYAGLFSSSPNFRLPKPFVSLSSIVGIAMPGCCATL